MSTVIYPSPIFGPVHSRRLGISLGINLMPADGKVCTFDCIYCECGFNADHRPKAKRPTREEVAEALERKLAEMVSDGQLPDVLTFAGNGEPTAHPDFGGIIDDTIRLRDKYCPKAKVSVLSNATRAMLPEVHKALEREAIRSFGGKAIVQTMFMGGTMNGEDVDNTSEEYVGPWLEAVKYIKPRKVMIYTIDRETPDHDLKKTSPEVLDAIRDRVTALGIDCSAAY